MYLYTRAGRYQSSSSSGAFQPRRRQQRSTRDFAHLHKISRITVEKSLFHIRVLQETPGSTTLSTYSTYKFALSPAYMNVPDSRSLQLFYFFCCFFYFYFLYEHYLNNNNTSSSGNRASGYENDTCIVLLLQYILYCSYKIYSFVLLACYCLFSGVQKHNIYFFLFCCSPHLKWYQRAYACVYRRGQCMSCKVRSDIKYFSGVTL